MQKTLYSPDVTPHHWVLPHRKNFHEFIDSTFVYPRDQYKPSECELYEHQRCIKDLLQPLSPFRGLLLFHSLGTGKGRSTIATCGQYSQSKKVFVLLPASLVDNFMQELRSCAVIHRPNSRWILSEPSDSNLKLMQVSREFAQKQGGVWIQEKMNNNETTQEGDEVKIQKQIDHSIRNIYNFVHYNGGKNIYRDLMANMDSDKETCFDDAIVVIDEVHNFISRVLNAANRNEASTSTKIYDQIVRANRVKVIALSGTPLINKAIELSYLMNLITGTLKIFKFPASYTNENVDYLKSNRNVDDFTYNSGYFQVALLPHNFLQRKRPKSSNKMNNSIIHISKLKDQESRSVKDIVQEIKESICPTQDYVMSSADIFPLDNKIFESLFVSGNAVHNPRLLSTRLAGLTSHYDIPSNHENYPAFDGISLEYVEMSDYQATVYTSIRNIEKEKEARDKKRNAGKEISDQKSANYKAFSRMACNFVFPEKYKRPVKQNVRGRVLAIPKKVSLHFDDASEEEDEVDHKLDADIQTTIENIERDKYFTIENLSGSSGLSPKFARLIKNVHASPGPCLIYSFFRKIEGISLLKAAFEEFGYHHLHLDKDGLKLPVNKYKPCFIIFSDDKAQNTQLLNIFNSAFDKLDKKVCEQLERYRGKNIDKLDKGDDGNNHGFLIKALMITQSGAEGISLKCVRQVHLVEPYWHKTRIQQVIGRAMRSNSHKSLPSDEKRVKAYLYLSIYKALGASKREETTDEWIYNLGERKQNILDSFLNVMKLAAVNCNNATRCFRPYELEDNDEENNSSFSLFDVNKDAKDVAYVVSQKVREFRALTDSHSNTQLWLDEDTGSVHVKMKSGLEDAMDMNPIGEIIREKDGRIRLIIY